MITVQNKRKGGRGIYIGRGNKHMAGSPLGNPFKMKHEGDRDRVVEAYRVWLADQMKEEGDVKEEVYRLVGLAKAGKPVNLVCWCAPKRCHGDVVKQTIEEILQWDATKDEDKEFSNLVCSPTTRAPKQEESTPSIFSPDDFPPLGC